MHVRRPRRRVGLTRRLVTALVVLAGLAVLAPLTPPASTASVGVDDYPPRLKSAAQDSLVDPWLFYNRECTSFVAWRLNHDAGVPFHNYYLGVHWGNASNWKYAATQVGIPVDDTPRRGAVAWWAAGSPGSSRGHVAYVMAKTRSSITIEEYNYLSRGHYDQRTISSSSSMWPSAFIHVRQVVLRNTTAPSISGTPKVWSKLVANRGRWSPSGATFTYQWLADGVAISGATNRSFAPRPELLGKRLQVKVTASLSGATPVTVTSPRTAAVAPGDFSVTSRPTITGTPQVGQPLAADPGSWKPSASSYAYQWLANGVPVDNATRRTFTPHADQLGTHIQVQVTASGAAMNPATKSSLRTDAVAPGDLTVQTPPTITGTPQVDSQLSATAGTWSPRAKFAYQWYAGGTAVPNADSSTFSPSADQLRQRISVQVTASRDGYATASSKSPLSSRVIRATFAAIGTPTISGIPQVDKPLSAQTGTWSPTGTPSYQWYVNGAAVAGATNATFTPTADDLRKQVAVKVRMTRDGYRTTSSVSAASDPVAPGTFVNTTAPSVSGTAKVGVPLTVDPGSWEPAAQVTYQWYADGVAVPGETARTFTPTAAELGKQMTVQVTARRYGYLTAVVETAPTANVAPGTIAMTTAPRLSGDPVVGGTLTASPGSWSVTPTGVAYQWYADGVAITGATGSTYSPTKAMLDHQLTVRVTVSLDGYLDAHTRSAATRPVVLGHIQFNATPWLAGTPELGRTLTAHTGGFAPTSADASYEWLRSGQPIAHAGGSTYTLVPRDVGQRISVRVTLTAPHWASTSARSSATARVRSVPDLHVHSRVVGHRVLLRLGVDAPGITDPAGRVIVTEQGDRVGKVVLEGGRGRLVLAHVSSGNHRYRFVYSGPMQATVTRRLLVQMP